MNILEKIEKLELILPPAPKPLGVYKPTLIIDNFLYVSGQFDSVGRICPTEFCMSRHGSVQPYNVRKLKFRPGAKKHKDAQSEE